MVALIKPLMNLLRETEGVRKAILAGGSLTGDHRANLRARAAGLQAMLCQKSPERLDIGIGYPLDLHRQPGSHSSFPGAESLSSLGDGSELLRGKLAVNGDDPDIKAILGSFIPQAAKPFDPGYLLRTDGASDFRCIHNDPP